MNTPEDERLKYDPSNPDHYRLRLESRMREQAAEIERFTTDRRVLQSDGKHQAPCARFCEANAFTIELRQAKKIIERKDALLRDALDALIGIANTFHEGRSVATDGALGYVEMNVQNTEAAIANIKTELEEQP